MPRTARITPAGLIVHVLNSGVAGLKLFRTERDYAAFLQALIDTLEIVPIKILAFCIMPTHWHLVLLPERPGQLGKFMQRLTITHARRWLEFHEKVGTGHIYQGRYKSFPVEEDEHLLTCNRYVERNALRARLVRRAQDWPWSSLGQSRLPRELQVALSDWPIKRPSDWVAWVNQAQTAREVEALHRCIREGRPYGGEKWLKQTMSKLGWREPGKPGRPRKRKAK